MNLANKLTIFRVILIPFFVVAFLYDPQNMTFRLVADILFIVASLTDMLDGKIARKYNLVTDFGKFMDPLADKLLVCAALICLVDLGQIPAWIVIIIISREFIISGFRLIAATNGVVIAASYWGKFKTVFQMAMIICMVIHYPHPYFSLLESVLMWIATALTVISLIDYIVKNKTVFGDTKSL